MGGEWETEWESVHMKFSSISILQEEHFLAPFSAFPLRIKNKRLKSQYIQTSRV